MLARLRRDFAFRSLLWWVPLALLGGLWVWGMARNVGLELGAIPFDGSRPGLWLFVFLWWTWLSIYLANAGMDHRTASVMDLGLPIAPRALWLEHVSLVVGGGISILAIVCLTIAVGNLAAGIRPLVQPGIAVLALHLGVGLLLATAILQIPQPGLQQAKMSVRHVFILAITMFGYLGLTYVLGHAHPGWSIVPLLVAIALYVRSYQRVPTAGFRLVTSDVEEAAPLGTGSDSNHRGMSIDLTVWRACYGVFGWAYVLPMMFNMGAFLADPSYEERFTFRFFFWIVAFAGVVYPLSRLYMVDSLPVGRRRIFAGIMLPPVLVLGLGFTTGIVVREKVLGPYPRVEVKTTQCCTHVEVPFSHWRIAREGDPGIPPGLFEHESDSHAVRPFKGSRTIVYNPYQVAHDADDAAIEAARARAVAEVRSSELGWAIPAEALLLVAPWFLLAAIAYRVAWSGLTSRIATLLNLTIMGPLVAIGAGLLLLQTVGLVDVSAWSRIASIRGREMVEAVPGGGFVAGFLVLILCTLLYFVAESQFMRVEATVKRG
jgi:hypothetical protein